MSLVECMGVCRSKSYVRKALRELKAIDVLCEEIQYLGSRLAWASETRMTSAGTDEAAAEAAEAVVAAVEVVEDSMIRRVHVLRRRRPRRPLQLQPLQPRPGSVLSALGDCRW